MSYEFSGLGEARGILDILQSYFTLKALGLAFLPFLNLLRTSFPEKLKPLRVEPTEI